MTDTIKTLEQLIEANKAEPDRTPFLDMMKGGLITARDNAQWHMDALAKAKATAPKPPTPAK